MQEGGGKWWSCNNTNCKGSLHFPGNKLPNKKKHTATKTAGIHFQKFHTSRHHHLPCSSPQVAGMNYWHMSWGVLLLRQLAQGIDTKKMLACKQGQGWAETMEEFAHI